MTGEVLPDLGHADACPYCRRPHGMLDDFRCCPDHGHELIYYGTNGERDRYICPLAFCKYERWIRKPPASKEPPMTVPAIHHPQPPVTELAIRGDQTRFDKYQLAALRQLGIENAPNADLAVFFHYCKAHHLDPFSRHATMVNYGGQWTIQTEIDGYRYIAHRAANRRGDVISVGAPTYYDQDEQPHRAWVRPGPPGMVEVTVVKNGAQFTGQAGYLEFVKLHPKTGKPMGLWEKMPANQTRKCAEAQAWRMAYQDEFADIPQELPIQPEKAEHVEALTAQMEQGRARVDARVDASMAVRGEWEKLSVDPDEEGLNLTAKLLGIPDTILDSYSDVALPDLQRVAAQLRECDEIGQVHALIDHGDKP